MLLIVLSRTVKIHSVKTHLFMYFFLTLAYFIHSIRFKAFNYPRLSMLHSVSLAGVYWLAFVNILDNLSSPNSAFVILLFVGWGVLIVVALTL
jgi:hypothetical protein